MSNDPTVRRILPQNSQMGAFSFAPPTYQQQPRETQKSAPPLNSLPIDSAICLTVAPDYVFVDEHNRHKRLKGMHASAPQLFKGAENRN